MTNLQLTTATFIVGLTFAIATAATAGMINSRYETRVNNTYDDYSATHSDFNRRNGMTSPDYYRYSNEYNRTVDARIRNNVDTGIQSELKQGNDTIRTSDSIAPSRSMYYPNYTADDYNRMQNNALDIR